MEDSQSQSLSQKTQDWIRTRALELGAYEVSFAPLGRPMSVQIYQNWLQDGRHGQMSYLERHYPLKEVPQRKWPQMLSAIVMLVPYENDSENLPLKAVRTALYSQSEDYHSGIPKKFAPLLEELKENFQQEEFLLVTDSSPIMERDLAFQAGLGWFGKNSCLISRQHGSLFLIAEVLTSFRLETAALTQADHCGKCNRCVEACPTEAILPDRTLDATKCISYWTIESKELPPLELTKNFNDWFFGCDICQTVCPWNEKVYGKLEMRTQSTKTKGKTPELIEELRWILTADEKEFQAIFSSSPLLRSKAKGLKRNALTVVANLHLKELSPEVEKFRGDSLLDELAVWVLERLKKD